MRPIPAFISAALLSIAPALAAPPTLTGPIQATGLPGSPGHDYPFFASNHDLPELGYIEEEYFAAGTANRYETPDLATGKLLDSNHPYKTRLIVRRPADPAKFNGTVLVEWLNVTNGFDADNTWFFSWEHMVHSGYAWVGVSTQRIGVDRLKAWSPRYASLDVTDGGKSTDDAMSYDIFTQIGDALRHPAAIDLLHGLKPNQILAIGESQSAGRLSLYINSVDPLEHTPTSPIYDGFLLLSAFGYKLRPDPTPPVFKLSTEYDVQAADAAVRQPDGPRMRTWEIAGTSHVDQHLRASREPLELRDFGTSAEAKAAPACGNPDIGTRTPTRDVVAAATDLLVRWVATNTPPPSAPPLDITGLGTPVTTQTASTGPARTTQPAILARDDMGLATGGIRLSDVAVPVGQNIGTNTGPDACPRWGFYQPYDLATLTKLYPSHAAYAAKVEAVTKDNLAKGYIIKVDADRVINAAHHSLIGAGP